EMVKEVHKVTVTDASYPNISAADATCIQQAAIGVPLVYPCVNNTGGAYGLMSYYDVNGNGETDGVIPNNVTTFDAVILTSYINAADNASKLSVINSNMAHVNRLETRRLCDTPPGPTCTSDEILLSLHDFDNSGAIDQGDLDCLTQVILTGGGAVFHAANPGCRRTDDARRDYNVVYYRYNQVTTSTVSALALQAFINGMIGSYDNSLANVKIVTDIHGCTQSPIAAPDATLALGLSPNTNTYNINTGDNISIVLEPTGGDGNYSLSFTSNVAHPSMSIVSAAQDSFVFNPDMAGTYVVDIKLDDSTNSVTQQVTFNVTNPVPTGSAPVFSFALPWANWDVHAYAKGTGSSSYTVGGDDIDGGETVTMSSIGMAPGDSVTNQAFNPGMPNRFRGAMVFQRNPAQIGTYNFQIIATDTGFQTATRNLTYTLHAWFENITNPLAGNAPVNLTLFSEGAFMGEDVPFSIAVGETMQIEFEYPAPPAGETWGHNHITTSILASPCPNTPGVTYVAHATKPNTAVLTYTPTSAGQQIVCTKTSVSKMSMSKLIWGEQEHRLRINVTGAPVPALLLSRVPAQSNFSMNTGDNLQIELLGSGGTPALSYGFENASGGASDMSMTYPGAQQFFNFIPTVSGNYTVDLFVTDTSAQKTSHSITINVTDAAVLGSAPEFVMTATPYEGQTYYHFAVDRAIGHSYDGEDADGGASVSVSVVDSGIVTDDWAPSGDYISEYPQASCNGSDIKDFCGMIWFMRSSSDVGTYNVVLRAEDTDTNVGFRNFTYMLEAWSETILNVNDGNSVVTLTDYNDGGVTGVDVSGDFEVNSEIRLEIELPISSSGHSWVYSQPASLKFNPCSNPAGVTFEAHATEQNKAILSYTPTAIGQLEICLFSEIKVVNVTTKVFTEHGRRLRFNIGSDVPALALSLTPDQTIFSATTGELLHIDLAASGGNNSSYTFGFENISGGGSSQSMTNGGTRFSFNPSSVAVYTADLYVIDGDATKTSQTITINASNLTISLADGDSAMIPRTGTTYFSELDISGGIGLVENYTYVIDNISTDTIGGTQNAGVSAGTPPTFKFQPDSTVDYSSYGATGGLFEFRITVTDTVGNNASTVASINVTNNLQCLSGFYLASSTRCCRNDEVLDPSGLGCVNSSLTRALVDKQDFMSPIGSAGFPSLCQMDDQTNYIGVQINLSNSINFNLDPSASDHLISNCRVLAGHYSNYDVYALGGDFVAGINKNDTEFVDQVLDTGINEYDLDDSDSNSSNNTITIVNGNGTICDQDDP
ncbi:hypothetical protein N9N67_11545, partial [Bacteriovoracaceae bacterium]|nr:hypothetical protein [Bacteriovoracaceae bacterium]